MAKRMSDDEVENFVFSKLFGDLDGIEAHQMFEPGGEGEVEGEVPNAAPVSQNSGGVKITVEPLMAAAQEGGKPSDTEEEDEEDNLKGISKMSPMMERLHPGR